MYIMIILIPYTSNDVQQSTTESIISVFTTLPLTYNSYIEIVPNNDTFDFEQASKKISELLVNQNNSKKKFLLFLQIR
jgi:hypothetical protein